MGAVPEPEQVPGRAQDAVPGQEPVAGEEVPRGVPAQERAAGEEVPRGVPAREQAQAA